MSPSREQVMDDVLHLLNQLSDDWEYTAAITAQTGLLSDLGFESLELVVLGVSIQEHYGQNIPFEEFLADIGERKLEDIFVGDLVEFTHRHVQHAAVGGSQ
jgi:acyl carrier protein